MASAPHQALVPRMGRFRIANCGKGRVTPSSRVRRCGVLLICRESSHISHSCEVSGWAATRIVGAGPGNGPPFAASTETRHHFDATFLDRCSRSTTRDEKRSGKRTSCCVQQMKNWWRGQTGINWGKPEQSARTGQNGAAPAVPTAKRRRERLAVRHRYQNMYQVFCPTFLTSPT